MAGSTIVAGRDSNRIERPLLTDESGKLQVAAAVTPGGTQDVKEVGPQASDVAAIKADAALNRIANQGSEADLALIQADAALNRVANQGSEADLALMQPDLATLKADTALIKADIATMKADLALIKPDVDKQAAITPVAANVASAYASVAASQTTSQIVAAPGAGYKLRVLAYIVQCDQNGPTTFKFKSATTQKSAQFENAANGGRVAPYNPAGHFDCAENEALTCDTGAGGTTAVDVVYETVAV